jgi:hypothetical protein
MWPCFRPRCSDGQHPEEEVHRVPAQRGREPAPPSAEWRRPVRTKNLLNPEAGSGNRVTGRVCEKAAQNVAQPNFCQKIDS